MGYSKRAHYEFNENKNNNNNKINKINMYPAEPKGWDMGIQSWALKRFLYSKADPNNKGSAYPIQDPSGRDMGP